ASGEEAKASWSWPPVQAWLVPVFWRLMLGSTVIGKARARSRAHAAGTLRWMAHPPAEGMRVWVTGITAPGTGAFLASHATAGASVATVTPAALKTIDPSAAVLGVTPVSVNGKSKVR